MKRNKPTVLYQPEGSCGHPARYYGDMCEDCVRAIPPLSDEAALAGLSRVERIRFARQAKSSRR